jgi:hypothetical protein
MKNISKRRIAAALFFALATLACCRTTSAQATDAQQKDAYSLIDSMAKTVYNLAWPTAKYRDVSYAGIEPAEGGFDVLVKLSGQSAFDDSDLWVKLAFMFRNGAFYDIRVRDDNAILMRPFATTTALATTAASLAKQYADEQRAKSQNGVLPAPTPETTPTYVPPTTTGDPASPSAEGTCLSNSTSHEVSFEYRWGQGEWTDEKLEPNQQMAYWWKYKEGGRPSPEFFVRFGDPSAPQSAPHVYHLDRAPTTEPPVCESLTNFHFAVSGAAMDLFKSDQ